MKIVTINLQDKLIERLSEGNRSEKIRDTIKLFREFEGNTLEEFLFTEDGDLRVITVNIPKDMRDWLNSLARKRIFPSRSEAIRFILIHQALNELQNPQKEVNEESVEESFKVIRVLNSPLPTRDDKNKPWEYTKPKKLLRLFPTEINLDLTISHLAERESLTPEELKKLMGYNSKEQYRDVLRINKEYPDLILRKWGRGLHNARQLESFTINREKLKELLK